MKKYLLLFMALCIMVSFIACGDEVSTPEPEGDQISDADRVLVFMVDGMVYARMVVLKEETYDELVPYFPTIPQKAGYHSYWEKVTIGENETYINAMYVRG